MQNLASNINKYKVGDIISLKKGHPCGENQWKIERLGADIKLKCIGCDRDIWMKRFEFDKKIRKIWDEDQEKMVSIVHYQSKDEKSK